MHQPLRFQSGWNATEILALIVLVAIIGTALYSLFAAQGLAAFKTIGMALLIGIPIVGLIIWKNQRTNRRLQEKLRR